MVADPFPCVIEGVDAEAGDMATDLLVDRSCGGRRGWHQVIDDDDGLVWIKHPIDPDFLEQVKDLCGEDIVQESEIDIGNNELPCGDLLSA